MQIRFGLDSVTLLIGLLLQAVVSDFAWAAERFDKIFKVTTAMKSVTVEELPRKIKHHPSPFQIKKGKRTLVYVHVGHTLDFPSGESGSKFEFFESKGLKIATLWKGAVVSDRHILATLSDGSIQIHAYFAEGLDSKERADADRILFSLVVQ